MDGVTEVTDENRPRGFLPDRIFTPMLELRSALVALDLSDDELAAAKRHAVTCGGGAGASGAAEALLGAIDADETKEMLKDTTAEAVSLGAYGAPFIAVTQEGGSGVAGAKQQPPPQVFFGSDRFEQLAFTMGWSWHGPDPQRPTATANPKL